MPAKPRQSKARGPFTPTNKIAARLELISGRSPLVEYHDDHITRPTNFPDDEDRAAWYWTIRDSLVEHWHRTGRRPWAVAHYEPDLTAEEVGA